MIPELKYDADDEQATTSLGTALAESLLALPDAFRSQGAVIALIGPLGAGKTRFVQAVAQAAGVEPGTVSSPTFVLIHEYEGRVPIYHFDAYRLRSEVEFAALGSDEYFARPCWSFIEWADRVTCCLPQDRLEISILPTGPTVRQFSLCAHSAPYEKLLAELSQRLTFY